MLMRCITETKATQPFPYNPNRGAQPQSKYTSSV